MKERFFPADSSLPQTFLRDADVDAERLNVETIMFSHTFFCLYGERRDVGTLQFSFYGNECQNLVLV